MKGVQWVAIVFLCCATASACSIQSFTTTEGATPDFSVRVTHRDRPAIGIEVMLQPHGRAPIHAGVSDEKGEVRIRDLAPGKYFLSATYHGINTESKWIEVGKRGKNIGRFDLHWADYSIDTNEMSGVLSGLVSGNSGNKLMDLIHARETVYSGVSIKLDEAFGTRTFSTITDSSGAFLFGPVPAGTYFMTIAGAQKTLGDRISDPDTVVVDVSASSKRDSLPLLLRDSGCGGLGYELKTN